MCHLVNVYLLNFIIFFFELLFILLTPLSGVEISIDHYRNTLAIGGSPVIYDQKRARASSEDNIGQKMDNFVFFQWSS